MRMTCQQKQTARRKWIAPRSGGYRPGGDFNTSGVPYAASTVVSPPSGSGGVVLGSSSLGPVVGGCRPVVAGAVSGSRRGGLLQGGRQQRGAARPASAGQGGAR